MIQGIEQYMKPMLYPSHIISLNFKSENFSLLLLMRSVKEINHKLRDVFQLTYNFSNISIPVLITRTSSFII